VTGPVSILVLLKSRIGRANSKGKFEGQIARHAHANFAPHTSPSFQNVVLPAVWRVLDVRARRASSV
jgi:hypothetical protein